MSRVRRAPPGRDRPRRLAGVRRATWFPLWCPALLWVPGACAAPDARDDRVGTVSVACQCDERALGPMLDASARRLVFLPLVTFDAGGTWDGRLAKGWEHGPDYREWRFDLRTDVRWHDGVPVTAADVKFTIDLWAHPDVRWYGAWGVESVTAPDDSTIVIRYREPTDALRYQPWLVYYPEHLLETLDPARFYDWEFWSRPVGNGPYRFVRVEPETMIEFEANPDYYAGRPPIDRVILRFTGDAGVRELLAGGVDAASESDPDVAQRIAEDPAFQAYHAYSANVGFALYWRASIPPFDDAGVRRALVAAIDRRELLAVLGHPPETPVVDGPFTERQLRLGSVPPAVGYDPEAARSALASAGWVDADGDGIRERAGEPARFSMIVRGDPVFDRMAVTLQQQLRRVGVDIEIAPMDAMLVRKRLDAGEFEAALVLTGVPAGWLSRFFGAGSVLGYDDPIGQRLAARAESTADPARRDSLFAALTDVFRADPPAAFLFPKVNYFVARRTIEGLSSPWRSDPLFSMEELRLVGGGR